MSKRFYPSLAVRGIGDITPELLEKYGIKGLILDIDNTLAPDKAENADEKAVKWIEGLTAAGFKMCIVSNARKKRVVKFNGNLNLYAFHGAMKPRLAAFLKAGRVMGLPNRQIAVVGDQVFTDIYGGNRAGMFTILVDPVDKRENLFVRFKRIFERRILKKYIEWAKQNGIR